MLAAAAAGLVSLPLAAQEPPSRVERKNRAPVSAETLQIRLPRTVEATLPNGVSVLILEDHRLPSALAQFHIRGAGGLFEPPHLPGLAAMTAQMLREGTRKRNSKEIAAEIDRLGASIHAGTDFGSTATVLSASGLSENFDAWFSLALELLLEPSFPAAELDRLREQAKVHLEQQRASARFLASERFHRAIFGSHPASRVSTTLESLRALTPELLRAWHRERYLPRATILAIAGDVRAGALLPKLERWLADWNGGRPQLALPPNPLAASTQAIHLVDRPKSVQTTLLVGNVALDRRSPDFIPMVVANHILGGGSSGRLFLQLREEKGYTYGAYSRFTAVEYPGAWSASADVRLEVTAEALAAMLSEIRRIRETEVTQKELQAAKRAIVARFALALEQPSRLLELALTRKHYELPEDYWETYPAKIAAVSAAEVQRVARKYLDPERAQIVAVGDGQRIRPALEKFGPLELYDTSGKRLP